MSLEQVAKKNGMTLEQAKELKQAMCNTWDYIGYDFIECCGGEDEAMKLFGSYAAMIAEATVDADRLRSLSGRDVEWFYSMKGDIMKIAEEVYSTPGW